MDPAPHKHGATPAFPDAGLPAVSFRHRLETKLVLALVVVGLIPVVIFTLYTVGTLRDVVGDASRSILSATTRDYTDRIDTWINRGLDQVRMAARLPVFAEAVAMRYVPAEEWDPLENDLLSLRAQAPVFIRSVALFDLEGNVILQSPRAENNIRSRGGAWLETPLLTAEPAFHLCMDEPEAGRLVFSAPLMRGARPEGVIRIGYHISTLHHLLSQLTEVSRGPSFVAIVASDGTLLASDLPGGGAAAADWIVGNPLPLEDLRRESTRGHTETILEVDFPYEGSANWTVCLHRLEMAPWSIVYFLPSQQYMAPVRRRVAVALLTTGGLLLLLVTMGVASARVLSRDLRMLSRAAQAIAAGELETRVPERARDEGGLLARSFNNMARQLAQRTAALIEARHQAEAASRAKSDFLSVMSHEVRTPLNAVIGYSSLLKEDERLPRESRSAIENIHRAGTQLLGMLNDMLDFTKLEAGRVEVDIQLFPILELFSDVVEHTAAEAARKGLELVLEPVGAVPEQIAADGPKLRQILLNLVFNALKFTHEGGVHVYFEVDFAPDPNEGNLLVMIEDTGIGISPEVREKLFQPFSQGDSSVTRSYGGTGLGLAISRHIAHACGGDLTECSPKEGGATFVLSVPVRREGFANLPEPGLDPVNRGKPVIIFSGNPVSSRFLRRQLGKAGLRCVESLDEQPEVVVIDEPPGQPDTLRKLLAGSGGRLANQTVLHLHPPTREPMGLSFPSRRVVLAKPVLPHELLYRMNALLSGTNFVNPDLTIP